MIQTDQYTSDDELKQTGELSGDDTRRNERGAERVDEDEVMENDDSRPRDIDDM